MVVMILGVFLEWSALITQLLPVEQPAETALPDTLEMDRSVMVCVQLPISLEYIKLFKQICIHNYVLC